MTTRKIALVHDWLTGMRGGEKVLEVLCEIFPGADIFTLIHCPGSVSPLIEKHTIHTSFLQKIPGIERSYRYYLPLMPQAIERFDFSEHDLVISSSHCVAKGARPGPHSQHWCYCHTPMRYVWDQFDDYFGAGRSNVAVQSAMRLVRPYLQRWDVKTAGRVHHYLANSRNVQQRIERIYHRPADVLYPPVDVEFYAQSATPEDKEAPPPFYLIVSALAPYKRIDIAVEAFNRWGKELFIIGDGPEGDRLRKQAHPNIHFLGWADSEQLRWHYMRCNALLFPGEEDFGIVPLEAMAAGRPVVAYRKGGALETIVDGKTGVFFDRQTPEDLLAALERLETMRFHRKELQEHAQRFSRQSCISQFRQAFIEYTSEMS